MWPELTEHWIVSGSGLSGDRGRRIPHYKARPGRCPALSSRSRGRGPPRDVTVHLYSAARPSQLAQNNAERQTTDKLDMSSL